jgi:hypothetical protein
MKKILLLSLLSSSVVAMQPKRIEEIKSEDKSLKYDLAKNELSPIAQTNDSDFSRNAKKYAFAIGTIAYWLSKTVCTGSVVGSCFETIVAPELSSRKAIGSFALFAAEKAFTTTVIQKRDHE